MMPQFCKSALKKICQQPMTHTIASREHYLNLQAGRPIFELRYSAADFFSESPLNFSETFKRANTLHSHEGDNAICMHPAIIQFEPINSLASMMQIVKWTLCICKTFVLDEAKRRLKKSNQPLLKVCTIFLVRNNC